MATSPVASSLSPSESQADIFYRDSFQGDLQARLRRKVEIDPDTSFYRGQLCKMCDDTIKRSRILCPERLTQPTDTGYHEEVFPFKRDDATLLESVSSG